MTRIYKKAAGMPVWLGEQADGSDLAMDITRQVGDTSPRGPGEKEASYSEATPQQRQTNWEALIALFERPWWERVWARQEVTLAKDATVHCGSKTCSFGAVTMTLDLLLV
jgi:Heterokaryon incompatibility protein (HET)